MLKKIITVLICSALILSALPLTVFAESSLTLEKTEYTENEDIIVTATGTGKDWVGVYVKGEMPGSIDSIYWYYVDSEDNASGDPINLIDHHYNASRSAYEGLPVGEYTVYLLANDGYDVILSKDIKVVKEKDVETVGEKERKAPSDLKYTLATTSAGYAEGTVVITAPTGDLPDGYKLYWGDSKGKLAGYASMAPVECTAEATEVKIAAKTIIPEGATRLLAYSVYGDAVSEEFAAAELPATAVTSWGKPLYEFQVISDVHIKSTPNHIHNVHFTNALKDFAANSPTSIGVFVAGDLTDTGAEADYKMFKELYGAVSGAPKLYAVAGNHDLNGEYKSFLSRFLRNTDNDSEKAYFTKDVGGAKFIFLCSEVSGTRADLSNEQLSWFTEELDKTDSKKPVFILLHQAIYDTIAGSYPYQGWDGVNNYQKLSDVLKGHNNVIMFNGHSHWVLNSFGTMHVADDALPSIFSTSSCGYLWDDEAQKTNVGIEGSEGYYVRVYADKVLVLGRDFVTSEWLPTAQFIVEYESIVPAETTSALQTEQTQPGTDAVTDAAANTSAATTENSGDGEGKPSGFLVWAIVGMAVVIGAVVAIIVSKKKKA